MAVSASFSLTVSLKETGVDGRSTGVDQFTLPLNVNFLDAVGALGLTKFFADRRTLNTAAETLDFSGSLASKLATPAVFTKGRLLVAQYNGATGTGKFDFGITAGAVGLVDGSITLGAGGLFLLYDPTAAGRAITATTADLVEVTTTATATYDIALGGE